jgi:hypothetical protein
MLLDLFTLWWQLATGFANNPARTRCTLMRNDIKNFDPIEPGETDVFSIEFTQDLLNGRTALTPVFQCTVVSTDTGATPDATPSARLIGVANLSYSVNPVDQSLRTFANQKFSGFVVGNTYAINATISTNDGCTVQRYSRVYCAIAH